MSADDSPGTREIARRLFAAEYEDASLSYSESDEERAPNYVVTPTGARINRLFVVGVLTETESVNEDMLRARIVDPTGAFVAYAGQYQPEALAFFERRSPPEFVALSGKARTFQPEDSDRVFTSIRPESVNAVDADTRDRWVLSAATATFRRVGTFASALETGLRGDDLEAHLLEQGVDEALAVGIPRAIEHYGTTTAYLEAVRRMAVDALEVVAGEREEVRPLDLAPDEGGEAELGAIPGELAVAAGESSAEADEDAEASAVAETGGGVEAGGGAGGEIEANQEAEADTEATASESPETESPAATAAGSAESAVGAGSLETETTAEAGEESTTETEAETTADAETETMAELESDTIAETDSEAATETDSEAATETDSEAATEAETDAEPTDDAASTGGTEELGDFQGGGLDDDESAPSEEATADDIAEDEMYDLDDEERQEVEEEYGVSFESGAEIGDPGEVGIETPDTEGLGDATEAEGAETDEVDETESAAAEAPVEAAESTESDEQGESVEPAETEEESTAESADAADVDLEAVAVEAMDELDEGDGADREEVVAVVVSEYGADPGDVEDAIQDALMDGQCYEPGDGRLKAI